MQTPMRQYNNPQASGTVSSSKRRPDKMEPVIDRVMMIAERLVNAEKALTSYGKIISEQSSKIAELEAQIEGLKLSHFNPVSKTEAKTAPKTTASRKTGTKSSTSTK